MVKVCTSWGLGEGGENGYRKKTSGLGATKQQKVTGGVKKEGTTERGDLGWPV